MKAWSVPPIWEGGECWIIGGGPSMPRQFGVPEEVIKQVKAEGTPNLYSPYLSPIHDKHVIGVNAAYLIGEWIDIVVFGDRRFYLQNRALLAQFKGIKVGIHPRFSSMVPGDEKIKLLMRDRSHSRGISDNPKAVSWNHNTGAAAITIAANAGCKRIILLGFDMKRDDAEEQHWHKLYKNANRKTPNKRERLQGKVQNEKKQNKPFDRHLTCFPHIAKDASRRGIEIINACPDSAIEQFKKLTVKEILNG